MLSTINTFMNSDSMELGLQQVRPLGRLHEIRPIILILYLVPWFKMVDIKYMPVGPLVSPEIIN